MTFGSWRGFFVTSASWIFFPCFLFTLRINHFCSWVILSLFLGDTFSIIWLYLLHPWIILSLSLDYTLFACPAFPYSITVAHFRCFFCYVLLRPCAFAVQGTAAVARMCDGRGTSCMAAAVHVCDGRRTHRGMLKRGKECVGNAAGFQTKECSAAW